MERQKERVMEICYSPGLVPVWLMPDGLSRFCTQVVQASSDRPALTRLFNLSALSPFLFIRSLSYIVLSLVRNYFCLLAHLLLFPKERFLVKEAVLMLSESIRLGM